MEDLNWPLRSDALYKSRIKIIRVLNVEQVHSGTILQVSNGREMYLA